VISAAESARDPVVVVPYDAAWPSRFRREARRLEVALRGATPVIEHIGSTSVPGLAAKPVIDLLVGVRSLDAFAGHADRLSACGYEYVPAYEATLPERRFFRRRLHGLRTHHVHVVELNGPGWRRYLAFRDRLRADAALAANYARLKSALAARFAADRDAYTEGKTGFVEAALALTLRAPTRTAISARSASPAA
jgi:GrpB-like predicted nucleotidyltransferase (UPF0157 family)